MQKFKKHSAMRNSASIEMCPGNRVGPGGCTWKIHPIAEGICMEHIEVVFCEQYSPNAVFVLVI